MEFTPPNGHRVTLSQLLLLSQAYLAGTGLEATHLELHSMIRYLVYLIYYTTVPVLFVWFFLLIEKKCILVSLGKHRKTNYPQFFALRWGMGEQDGVSWNQNTESAPVFKKKNDHVISMWEKGFPWDLESEETSPTSGVSTSACVAQS